MSARASILRLLAAMTVISPLAMAGCMAAQGLLPPPTEPTPATRPVAREFRADFDFAMAMVAQLRYAEAAESFLSLVGEFEKARNDTRAAEATFWLAYCREKQGRKAVARTLYKELVRKYPDTPASRNATDRLTRLP